MSDGSRCGVCGTACELAHEGAAKGCKSCERIADLQPEMCRLRPRVGRAGGYEGRVCGYYINIGRRLLALVIPWREVEEFGREECWLPSWVVAEVIAGLDAYANVQPWPNPDEKIATVGCETLAQMIIDRPPHPWQEQTVSAFAYDGEDQED